MPTKFFSGCVLGLALTLLGLTPCMGQANRKKTTNLRMPDSTSLIYKKIDGVGLKAHVFRPQEVAANQKLPCIAFFFGGGWRSGSPKQFEQHCRYFAARGMVAVTFDYRVSSRHNVKAKDCVADAKSAIRWLRENSTKLQIDENRIVASGGSAGGHLAACTGVVPGFEKNDSDVSSRPNALALFNPALVLASTDDFKFPSDKSRSLRERAGVSPKAISPIHHVTSSAPPTIIFHGEADTTVPYQTAKLFTQKMLAEGNTCELKGYAKAGHGFFNYSRKGGKFRETVSQLDAFLVELKFLDPNKSAKAQQLLK